MSEQTEMLPGAVSDAAYTEQGVSVYQVSDYEFIAAATREAAIAFALDLWGYTGHDAAKRAENDGCFNPADVGRCDLDTNKLQECDKDEEPTGELVTFREELRRQMARGVVFPEYFAGFDE